MHFVTVRCVYLVKRILGALYIEVSGHLYGDWEKLHSYELCNQFGEKIRRLCSRQNSAIPLKENRYASLCFCFLMSWSPVERFLFTTEGDHPDILKQLLQGPGKQEIFSYTTTGSTLLHICCLHKRPLCVGALLDLGLDVNETNDYGETPLHWASKFDLPVTCALLIANGACVNVEDCDGNLPLHWACEHNQTSVVKVLLAAHSRITENYDGETPLHIATMNGYQDIIKELTNHKTSQL